MVLVCILEAIFSPLVHVRCHGMKFGVLMRVLRRAWLVCRHGRVYGYALDGVKDKTYHTVDTYNTIGKKRNRAKAKQGSKRAGLPCSSTLKKNCVYVCCVFICFVLIVGEAVRFCTASTRRTVLFEFSS